MPPCVFLNDRYISYAEVYRHRELLDGAPAEASALAHDALAEARGYNFNTVDDDRAYLCCTSQARQFYLRLGLADLEAVGRVALPGIRANFETMKYPHLDAFFTPIDFIRSDRFVSRAASTTSSRNASSPGSSWSAASRSASPPEVFTGIACLSWLRGCTTALSKCARKRRSVGSFLRSWASPWQPAKESGSGAGHR